MDTTFELFDAAAAAAVGLVSPCSDTAELRYRINNLQLQLPDGTIIDCPPKPADVALRPDRRLHHPPDTRTASAAA